MVQEVLYSEGDKALVELIEYVAKFSDALRGQLEEDEKRWGDTWKRRSRKGQEDRIAERMETYIDQWRNAGTPMPWLKIAGLCLIAMLREEDG